MLAKRNDVVHSEWASVRTADCDDELLGARVEIYGINHEVEDRITVHPVNGIAGIIEATPELPLKVRLVPKRRDLPIVESYDLVTDKNSRRTGYRMLYVYRSQHSVSHVVRRVTFSANQQEGSLYYGEFDTEIKARNFVLAFPLSGVRFIRPAASSSAEKQRWLIAQTYRGNGETIDVMFCCF